MGPGLAVNQGDIICGDGSGVALPVTDLEDHRPHLSIPTLDGNVHVLPCLLIENIISGKTKISACENFETVVRTIIREWYSNLEVTK